MNTVEPLPGDQGKSRAFFVIGALIVVGIVAAAGAGLGDRAGDYVVGQSGKLRDAWRFTIDFGGGALGVTLLAATAKDAIGVFGNIPDYYDRLLKRAVLQDALKVFVATFSVMFASHSITALSKSNEEPQVSVEELMETRLSVPIGEPQPVAIFPVLFSTDGTLVADESQAPDHMHVDKKAWKEGVDVSDDRVAEIIAVLGDCKDPRRAQSVQVKVFGYSSSKEVTGTKLDDRDSIDLSNTTNTRLANIRAHNVHEKLRRQLVAANLQDDVLLDPPVVWRDYEGMVSTRPVMDRISDEKRPELENWSRRADVHITSAGKCDRLDILRKTRIIRGQPLDSSII